MLPTYGVSIDGDRVSLVSVRADIAGLPSPANDAFFADLVGQRVTLVATRDHPGRTRRRLHRLGDWDGLPTAIYGMERALPSASFETDLEDAAPALAPHRDPDRLAALWADARSDRPLEARIATLVGALFETSLTSWHAADALRDIGPPAAVAVPALARLADHPDLNPACFSLRALGAIADPRAIGPLTIALGRGEPYRTTYALRSLGVFGPSIAADTVSRAGVPDGLPRWQQLAVSAAIAWARWRVLGEEAAAFFAFAAPGDPEASAALLEVLWDCPTPLLREILPMVPNLPGLAQHDWVAHLASR